MYLPSHFEETDPAALHALMRAYPLGTWITPSPEAGVDVNHLPFLLDADHPAGPRLLAHLPRGNPVWRGLAAPGRSAGCQVIFHGPQGYISPGWYASKPLHGKVVPTWNYAVVHAHGEARVLEGLASGDPAAVNGALLDQLQRLTATHEASQPQPWSIHDAPPDYTAGLMRVLVCVEIRLTRLVGKFKLSQNRPLDDRLGVVAGLQARGDAASLALADLMAQREPSTPRPD